jgi:hypothetical protein
MLADDLRVQGQRIDADCRSDHLTQPRHIEQRPGAENTGRRR